MNERCLKKRLLKDSGRIERFIERHRRVYVYGTGAMAQDYLKEYSFVLDSIECFLVSPEYYSSNRFFGKKVLSCTDGLIDDDAGVIVIANETEEIVGYLLNLGVKRSSILCVYRCSNELPPESYYYSKAVSNGIYFEKYQELNTIGEKHDTDKSGKYHNYLHQYEFFVEKWKDDCIVVLELGVYKGSSMYMWGEYFKNGIIYGVDINENCLGLSKDNCHVLIKDLSEMGELIALTQVIQPPKVIIDDASHRSLDQIMALVMLFPFLEKGGIYIIEDIETSFGYYLGTTSDNSVITCFEFCKAISEALSGGMESGTDNRWHQYSDLIVPIVDNLDMISFIRGSCILVKR